MSTKRSLRWVAEEIMPLVWKEESDAHLYIIDRKRMPVKFQYKYFGWYRLFLAFMVVVSHMEQQFAPDWLHKALAPLHLGMLAVLLFFVVSGYVIYEACDQFYLNRPGAFLLNRFLRIYPPFIFALFVSLLVHVLLYLLGTYGPIFQSTNDVLGHLSGKSIFKNFVSLFDDAIPNGREQYYLFVRYVWAVVVEIQFYLTIAVIFFIRKTLSPNHRVGFGAIFFLFAFVYILHSGLKVQYIKGMDYAPYFLLGITVYRIQCRKQENHSWLALFLVATSLSIYAFYLSVYRDNSFSWVGYIVVVILLLIFVALVLFERVGSQGSVTKLKKVDGWLGDFSYPIYLNHFAIEVAVFAFIRDRLMGTMAVSCLGSLLVAWIAVKSVEPVTYKLRDKIRGNRIR